MARSIRLVARTRAWILGERRDAWRLAEPGEVGAREVDVELVIEGDEGAGFHLCQTPEGSFTADTWSATLEEARDDAQELFGVARSTWVPEP